MRRAPLISGLALASGACGGGRAAHRPPGRWLGPEWRRAGRVAAAKAGPGGKAGRSAAFAAAVPLALTGALTLTGAGTAEAQVDARTGAQRAACFARGGWVAKPPGSSSPVCFTRNPDAGAACRKAGDCIGECMADTLTCAPVSPQYNCYGYMDDEGRPVFVCVN